VDLRRLERLLHLVGDALAVGGGVVDHRNGVRLVVGGEIAGDGRALLVVTADHAELGLETLLGELGVGGRARDHRDAGAVVDRRGRDRGARVQMADHAGDFGVDQLLRDRGADFGIGLVVLGDEDELHFLAVELGLGRVGFLDREARAVLVVLAEVRDAAGERADVADFHFSATTAAALAAAGQRERGCNGGNAEFHVLHGVSQGVRVRCFRRRISYRARACEKQAHFCERIHFTRVLMSASGTALFGGIGTVPHTPWLPFFTLAASFFGASLSARYFAATSL